LAQPNQRSSRQHERSLLCKTSNNASDGRFWTWGAIDALGIPAGLGEDAVAENHLPSPAIWEGEFDATTATDRYRAYVPAERRDDER
jgi:hypothetical protein